MSDRVSIVVLTYNDFSLLPRCLESVFAQDYQDIELIIQDDGSKNYDRESIEVLVGKKRDNIRNVIINHNSVNVGTVKNYNNAVKTSIGDYIIPLSCDDVLFDSEVISNIVHCFQKTQCNVCTGYVVGELSQTLWPSKKEIQLLLPENRARLRKHIYASNFISGAAIYWRASYLKGLGGFDEEFILVEDYPMVLRLIEEKETIMFIPQKTVIHGENGVSTRWNTLKKKNMIAHNDAKRIKDKYVMPYLNSIDNKGIRRYIEACYYLKFSRDRKQFIVKLFKYVDVWVNVAKYLLWKKINRCPEICYYEYKYER